MVVHLDFMESFMAERLLFGNLCKDISLFQTGSLRNVFMRTFKIEAQFEEKLMIIDITLSWKILEFQ